MSKLTTDSAARKEQPVARGVLDYFPNALAYVAYISKKGNDKHNPGEPIHWAREKSNDHADSMARHLIERHEVDEDGILHAGNLAWRALAFLQLELERRGLAPVPVGGEVGGAAADDQGHQVPEELGYAGNQATLGLVYEEPIVDRA